MIKKAYKYLQNGFDGVLYNPENGNSKGAGMALLAAKGKLMSDFIKRCIREHKFPEECEKAREDTLKIILKTIEAWSV